jgi:prophage antirepressor-like protein
VVTKDAKINAIIEEARGRSHPLAPVVILDQDLEFFVDALGERHDVEMRGARTVRGIYFTVKDVGRVFGTADLANDIQHKNTKPREGEDYVWFTMPQGEKKSASRELFFTFLGLLRAIMRARTPIAEQLCIWVCDIVFVHGFGNEDQKVELINKMDKKTLDTFMKCWAHDIACIYLLETSMKQAESTKKVFKFGFTKQLKSRMGKHSTTFGPDCVLDTIILIPDESLSGAEADLKRQLPTQYFFTHGSAQELLLLSEADRKTVRAAMQTVAVAYGGTTAVHEQRLKNVEQSYQLEIEKMKNEHLEERSKLKEALIVATKDVALAEKETMLAKKDIIILQMRNDEQARRLKELEDELRRYAKNRPSSPMR